MKRNEAKYNEISVQHLLEQMSTLHENNTTGALNSKMQKSRTKGKLFSMLRPGTRMRNGGIHLLIHILITRSDYLHTHRSLYSRGINLLPSTQGVVWVPEPFWILERKISLVLPGTEPRFPGHPALF
jgi:hypothetical protein